MENSCIFPTTCILILFFAVCSWSCKKDKKTTTSHDFTFTEPETTGNIFYIDPVNGSMKGDGSSENPWSTLQDIIENNKIEYYRNVDSQDSLAGLDTVNPGAPVKGGDKLILRNGYHGHIKLSVFIFKDWLTIEAQQGHTPVLSQFMLNGAFKKIYLKNLTIIKEKYEGEENFWVTNDINRNSNACVYLGSSNFWGKGSNVKLNGLILKTASDVSGWTAEDWVEKSAAGIGVRNVTNVDIVNCLIENIDMGISVSYISDYTNIAYNTIKNFSGDGARLTSNNIVFAYNTISNCYKVDDNHDDCIQSWSRGEDNSVGTGVVSNVVIRGNLLIGQTDMNNPLAGNPQGIGCFDGFFDNWTVENNVVITDHYHGISFYGFRNGKIVNNTVIDQFPGNNICPWIMITDHKNGTSSKNCVAANNIVSSSVSVSGDNVSEFNNYVINKNNYDQVYELFIDPDNFDLHLLKNELTCDEIIDKGEFFQELESSAIDKDQLERKGNPDIGAYEAE